MCKGVCLVGRLNKWALITGASSGIGREFSKILASKGYSLILVARRIDRLETLRNDLLNKYPIEIEIIGVDLANVKEVKDLYKDRKSTRLNSSHANISYAVFCLKKKNKPGEG